MSVDGATAGALGSFGAVESSPEISELAKGLATFQEKVRAVQKTKTAKVKMQNGGEYTYDYADLADVIESTREARTAAGIAVVQQPIGDARTITVVTTVIHSSGQWMRSRISGVPKDGKPQEMGSLITYLRRYSYSAALGICTEADDDGNTAQGNSATIQGRTPPKGERGSVAPAASASTHGDTGGTLSHPQRTTANKVEHTGDFASREKVDEMLALRSQVGGVMSACIPAQECKPTAPCAWHKMLSGYKHQGRPLRDLDKMSPAQIDHLIGRAKGYIEKQAARAAQDPDIGAVVDLATAASLRKELALKTETDAEFADAESEICGIFGADKFGELHPDDAKTAMGLLMVRGTPGYDAQLAKVREARS